MGYYDNPPIIKPNESYNAITAGIMSGSKAIAEGLILRGERRRQQEKEEALTVQKLQDQRNKTELYYNNQLTDWSKTHSKLGGGVDEQLESIVTESIRDAADAQISLGQETDVKERDRLKKIIRDTDLLMNNASIAGKAIAMDSATNRENNSALSYGKPGGVVVNGNKDQILPRTAFLDIVGGLDGLYTDTSVQVKKDSTGTGFDIIVGGKTKDKGTDFGSITVNTSAYTKADAEGNGGFLSKVEGLDEFNKTTQKSFLDDKGKILPGFYNSTYETVDLESKGSTEAKGKDTWQLQGVRRLNEDSLKNKIKETAQATAVGYLKAGKTQVLKNLVDYTLGGDVGFYEDKFIKDDKGNIRTAQQQEALLTDLLANSAFDTVTKNFEKTFENNKTIYWDPDAKRALKGRPSEASTGGGEQDKPQPTTYQGDYYDEIIRGYQPTAGEKVDGRTAYKTRSGFVENLNKLSGKQDKYITKEELLKAYKKSPYKSGKFATGLTIEEAFAKEKIKGTVEEKFNSLFGKGYVYAKEGEGAYKPVKYNVDSAVGRIKLALDQTADAGEKKMLQSKLRDAKLKDWTEANPRKQNETIEQYSARANKSN
jgi:hypothetical protein